MKRMTFKRTLLSSAMLICVSQLATSSSAYAGVNILTDDITVQTQAAPTQYFSQSGISGEKAVLINGGGDGMSLSLASKIIIPTDWKVNLTGDYQSKSVFWSGGVSWPHVIKNIADTEGVFVSLDWVKKVANLHVPESDSIQVASSATQDSLSKTREEYEIKSKTEWARRDDTAKKLVEEKARASDLISKYRASQEESQKFIAKLNSDNQKLSESRLEAEVDLAAEKEKRSRLEEKYAVIDPTLSKGEASLDSTDLFLAWKDRWVLPFDSSFEYYLKGGHSDVLLASTPATYIAKHDTVQGVVQHWADEINWHLEYRSQVRHKNPYQVQFKGSLYEAATDFIALYIDSRRSLDIKFFPDVKPTIDGVAKDGLIIVEDLNFKKN